MDDLLGASPRLPLGKLSEELGVDRHTLEKAVHRIRRKSFRDYQNKKLLRKAFILLAQEGNKSIEGYRHDHRLSNFRTLLTVYQDHDRENPYRDQKSWAETGSPEEKRSERIKP